MLGDIYASSLDGHRPDYALSAKWYQKAAAQGLATSQTQLAWLYETGNGVLQDYAEAMKWYRTAAEQGEYGGQAGLARMYGSGDIGPPDLVQVYKWANLAVLHVPINLKNTREGLIKFRDQVIAKMSPAQIAEAQKLAHDWKPTK